MSKLNLTLALEWASEVLSWSRPITTLPLNVMYTSPENMRLTDRDDHIFEPVIVSIGPYHYGKFPAMKEHKTRILSSMLHRHDSHLLSMVRGEWKRMLEGTVGQRGELLTELIEAARRMEMGARGYYSKQFLDIDFVQMMVFDGCFILEIFRMHAGIYVDLREDPIFTARWMLPALALDIVKLENQLPYFVLNGLYEITKLPGEPTLNDLAGTFLASLCPGFNKLKIKDDEPQDHLLSLFHSTSVRNMNMSIPYTPNYEEVSRLNSFPSATDLCLSGIKVVRKIKGGNLIDIEYKNGVLEIPTLVIDHSTKILMRNLIAYEQSSGRIPYVFTSYVTFMDAMVNSAEDVEVLRKAGVINHFMNSNEEVSRLLNGLTANIEYDMYVGYLTVLNSDIYNDHHSAMRQFRSRFRRLVNSREGIGYILTIFGVYLTVLQTVFTVLSYVIPK